MKQPTQLELYKAAMTYRELNNCYSIGKRPSEKLFDAMIRAGKTMLEMESYLACPDGKDGCICQGFFRPPNCPIHGVK